MNAGAYDGQMAGIVQETEYCGRRRQHCTLSGDEHGFDYRTSVFRKHPDWTVLRSTMQLQTGDSAAILDKMNDFAQRRRDKQPLNFPSAGSTFKRPVGHFAGQLIEDAGLKGTSVGAAQVSEKHAGFLINRGGATCDDMLRLIELVQEQGAGAVRRGAGVRGAHRKISSSALGAYHAEHRAGEWNYVFFDHFRYVRRRQEPRGRDT